MLGRPQPQNAHLTDASTDMALRDQHAGYVLCYQPWRDSCVSEFIYATGEHAVVQLLLYAQRLYSALTVLLRHRTFLADQPVAHAWMGHNQACKLKLPTGCFSPGSSFVCTGQDGSACLVNAQLAKA